MSGMTSTSPQGWVHGVSWQGRTGAEACTDAPQQAELGLTPQLRRSAQTTSKIETKNGAIRLPFSAQGHLSARAVSALLQLGIGLHAGGDLVVGCYVQISVLTGLTHVLLGFQLQLLSSFLVLGLAQLLGEFVTDFRNFLISLDKLLQIVIADRRSGRLTLLVLLLRSTSSLGHDSGSAHTEGGKGNGGGQSLEVFHGLSPYC